MYVVHSISILVSGILSKIMYAIECSESLCINYLIKKQEDI
jgi:hypothetical protein